VIKAGEKDEWWCWEEEEEENEVEGRQSVRARSAPFQVWGTKTNQPHTLTCSYPWIYRVKSSSFPLNCLILL
jgi:hypothetical protein